MPDTQYTTLRFQAVSSGTLMSFFVEKRHLQLQHFPNGDYREFYIHTVNGIIAKAATGSVL